jgi:hypothetical protein
MGIDALLVRLLDGEQAEADAPAMLAILASIGVDISGNADNIQTADGLTTVYNMQSAGELLAFSKPSGDAVWDIIHQVASAGGCAIFYDYFVCVTDPDHLDDLDDDMRSSAHVANSGTAVIAAMREQFGPPLSAEQHSAMLAEIVARNADRVSQPYEYQLPAAWHFRFESYADASTFDMGWLEDGLARLVERATPGTEVVIEAAERGTFGSKKFAFVPGRLDHVWLGMRNGKYDLITIYAGDGWGTIHRASEDRHGHYIAGSFGESSDIGLAHVDAVVQELAIELFLAGAEAWSAATGYMNFDHDSDPYGRHVRTEFEGHPTMGGRVFGYYWLTLLSPAHIAGLEANGRSVATAPVFRVRALPSGGVVLQLSESILAYSDEQLLALREFLLPLLCPGTVFEPPPLGLRVFENRFR